MWNLCTFGQKMRYRDEKNGLDNIWTQLTKNPYLCTSDWPSKTVICLTTPGRGDAHHLQKKSTASINKNKNWGTFQRVTSSLRISIPKTQKRPFEKGHQNDYWFKVCISLITLRQQLDAKGFNNFIASKSDDSPLTKNSQLLLSFRTRLMRSSITLAAN